MFGKKTTTKKKVKKKSRASSTMDTNMTLCKRKRRRKRKKKILSARISSAAWDESRGEMSGEKTTDKQPYLDPSEFPRKAKKKEELKKYEWKKNEVSMQRLAFALLMSAAVLLMVGFALRCIIFRQFFFFTPRVSRDNEVWWFFLLLDIILCCWFVCVWEKMNTNNEREVKKYSGLYLYLYNTISHAREELQQ